MKSAHYNVQERQRITHSAHECAIPTLQNYAPGSSTFHPSASSRTNLAQHGQKSTSACPEIIVATNPEYTNTQQDLPDQWVYLSPHI